MNMQNCTGNGGGYVIPPARPGSTITRGEAFMKIRFAFATLFAAIFFAAVPATYAAAGSMHTHVHAMFFKAEKKIKFSLRNGTDAPLELKIGDQVTTLKAGEVMPVKLPVGTRIISNTATQHLKVGDLIVQVSESMYSDSTLSIN
jgi:hypothetical protein